MIDDTIRAIVYLAGPYRDNTALALNRRQNIAAAAEWAAKLWRAGYVVLCSHKNAERMEEDVGDEFIMAGDREMIRAFAAGSKRFVLALAPGWSFSRGALGEQSLAKELGVRVAQVEELLAEAGA